MIKVVGGSKVVGNLNRFSDNLTKAIFDEVDNSYKRYQLEAFKRAPVKYGYLSSALVDDKFTKREVTDNKMVITQREGVDYMIYQEFNNPNGKQRFIRDTILLEKPKLKRDVESAVRREIKNV